MKHANVRRIHASLLAVLICFAPAVLAQRQRGQQAAQQPAQPAMQQTAQPPAQQPNQMAQQAATSQMQAAPSLCANRPLCYEANDFVVTVTEFRTSTDGRGTKILDAMLHFQNKTSQPISLGYVDQSGGAIDDMGNRFVLNTYGGGVRGMGVVAGNNMDPKFTLPGGGAGDARLEFWWPPYGKLAGVNYEMEFSIREMNRVEGNQWTLGDESLIHYSGLANGTGVPPVSAPMSAGGGTTMGSGGMAAPTSTVGNLLNNYTQGQTNTATANAQTMVAAGQPCPPGTTPSSAAGKVTNVANAAGVQNQTANNAISNASSAISSLGSLFGKKKQQQAQANQAAATTPCVAATTTNAVTTATPMAAPTTGPTNARTAAPATNPLAANPLATPTAAQSSATTRTASKSAQPAATAAKPSAVTNASMKQPATTTTTTKAKPASTTTPAKKPATTTTTTTNGSGGQ